MGTIKHVIRYLNALTIVVPIRAVAGDHIARRRRRAAHPRIRRGVDPDAGFFVRPRHRSCGISSNKVSLDYIPSHGSELNLHPVAIEVVYHQTLHSDVWSLKDKSVGVESCPGQAPVYFD